jgi:tRNA(His) 5'-end guanylyltransferase
LTFQTNNFSKNQHFKQNLIPTKREKVLQYLRNMQLDIHIKFLETTTFAHEWPNDGPSEGLHDMCNLLQL